MILPDIAGARGRRTGVDFLFGGPNGRQTASQRFRNPAPTGTWPVNSSSATGAQLIESDEGPEPEYATDEEVEAEKARKKTEREEANGSRKRKKLQRRWRRSG